MTDKCSTDVNATRLDALERDVNELYSTVYKGNGHESVVTQLNALDARLCSLKANLETSVEKSDARWESKLDSFAEKNQLKIDHLNDNINSRLGRIETSLENRLDSLESLLKAYNVNSTGKSEITWKSITLMAGIGTVLISGLITIIGKLLSE